MRKTLLATTALAAAGAFAAGPVLSADKMSVGVGGYMEQWFGMASVDGVMIGNAEKEGAAEVHADTELHFKGTLEADNGLTFTVDVQLEGTNNAGNYVDESFLKITGEFGDVRIGSEDKASNLMHYGHQDVGIGLTAGDTANWLGFGTPNTYGGFDDTPRLTYFTPRMEGVQLGLSYTPDSDVGQAVQNGKTKTANNDGDSVSVGLNYQGGLGDTTVALSAGYHADSAQMSGADDATYTNFGLHVGVGAFGFNIAYAEDDDGMDADETMTVGAKYVQGAMAISAGYGMQDRADGGEMSSVMLSASYTLAPGVEWRSSLLQAEDGDMEGSGFVTGFKVGF